MLLDALTILTIPMALTAIAAVGGDMIHTHRLRTTATARRETHPWRPGTVGATVVPCRVLPRPLSPFPEGDALARTLDARRQRSRILPTPVTMTDHLEVQAA